MAKSSDAGRFRPPDCTFDGLWVLRCEPASLDIALLCAFSGLGE